MIIQACVTLESRNPKGQPIKIAPNETDDVHPDDAAWLLQEGYAVIPGADASYVQAAAANRSKRSNPEAKLATKPPASSEADEPRKPRAAKAAPAKKPVEPKKQRRTAADLMGD